MTAAPPASVHPARKPLIIWIWVLTALIAATAVALVFAIRGDIRFAETVPNEIRLETASSLGDSPFSATPLADTPDPEIALATTSGTLQPAGASTAGGGTPGLYGGSNDMGRCDPAQLKTFLMANPDKAKAWVDALNRDPLLGWSGGALTVQDIPAYVDSLTSIILVSDTRVTNHGYVNGTATPLQVVLQKGTAVLVDKYGVPRAKCFCGNPLLPPQKPGKPYKPGTIDKDRDKDTPPGDARCFEAPEAGIYCDEGSDPDEDTTYTGDPWEDFDPGQVVEVQPVVDPITEFEVRVPATPEGELTTVPAGCEASGTCGDSTGTPAQPDPEPSPSTEAAATLPGQGCSPVLGVGDGDYVVATFTLVNESNKWIDVYLLEWENGVGTDDCGPARFFGRYAPGDSWTNDNATITQRWVAVTTDGNVYTTFTHASDGETWFIQ
ncbi:MAG TPA: DUF6777 domain-containing protein [Pseudolysinimonas sp.]|nr:DUF6777 domain-containing protein [Pseudolysinimonas sp.]